MSCDPIQQEIIKTLILSYSLNVGDFISSDFLSIKKLIGGSIFIWLLVWGTPPRAYTAYLEKLIFVKLESGLYFPEIPSYVRGSKYENPGVEEVNIAGLWPEIILIS